MGLELKATVAHGPDKSGTLPFYFSSESRRLFAWLHRPERQAGSDVGLVLCAPFGYEAICAHRSLRSFAEQASKMDRCHPARSELTVEHIASYDARGGARAERAHYWAT